MNFKKSVWGLAILFASCTSHVTEEKRISFIDDGNLVTLNGSVKQMTQMDDNPINVGQDYSIIYLNKEGDPIKIISGFHGMVDQSDYITGYDNNGKNIEVTGYFNPADSINIRNDSLIKLTKIDTTKKLMEIYKYDKDEHIIEYIVDPNSSSPEKSFYKYNSYGDLVESDSYGDPITTFYKYDHQHNLTERKSYINGHFSGVITYKYISFDIHNNWTKAIQVSKLGYESSGSALTINRKFTYY